MDARTIHVAREAIERAAAVRGVRDLKVEPGEAKVASSSGLVLLPALIVEGRVRCGRRLAYAAAAVVRDPDTGHFRGLELGGESRAARARLTALASVGAAHAAALRLHERGSTSFFQDLVEALRELGADRLFRPNHCAASVRAGRDVYCFYRTSSGFNHIRLERGAPKSARRYLEGWGFVVEA